MSRTVLQRICDIINSIKRCQEYVVLLESQDSILVSMAGDALERNLQIIGEAAKSLPEEITSKHPEIEWPQIRGFRNILVHQYFGVDPAIVRDVVQNNLPPLAAALNQYLL